MRQEDRVLARQGARVLTPSEVDHVAGGIRTTTLCTINPKTGALAGDARLGEC